MGTKQIYIAVRDGVEEEVLRAFNLKKTDQTSSPRNIYRNVRCYGAATKTGWYLLVSNHFDLGSNESIFADLSMDGELVYGIAEEHEMYFATGFYKNSEKIWFIENNADIDFNHFFVLGEPPDPFSKLRREAEKLHFSDNPPYDVLSSVPVQLFYSLTGYDYDLVDLSACVKEFNILENSLDKDSTHFS